MYGVRAAVTQEEVKGLQGLARLHRVAALTGKVPAWVRRCCFSWTGLADSKGLVSEGWLHGADA